MDVFTRATNVILYPRKTQPNSHPWFHHHPSERTTAAEHRTTEEGDLSAEWVSPFPRMSAVFWTDTRGRAQERDLCQPCGKELPCTPRCQYIAGGQSLSSHQNDQGGAPRCHRHQRTSGRFEAKPCSLLGTGA